MTRQFFGHAGLRVNSLIAVCNSYDFESKIVGRALIEEINLQITLFRSVVRIFFSNSNGFSSESGNICKDLVANDEAP